MLKSIVSSWKLGKEDQSTECEFAYIKAHVAEDIFSAHV